MMFNHIIVIHLQVDRYVLQHLAWVVNDTRGGPYVTRFAQTPAINGASTHAADFKGYAACGQTVYLDSIRYIPNNSREHRDRRKLWSNSFLRAPSAIRDKLTQRRPVLRTHVYNLAAGLRVEAGASRFNEGCHGTDAISAHVSGFDSGRSFGDCLAHCVMNNIKDMFSMASGSGRMKFTQKRQALERHLGRDEFLKWDTDLLTDSDDDDEADNNDDDSEGGDAEIDSEGEGGGRGRKT